MYVLYILANFWATICKMIRLVLSDRCRLLSVLSVTLVCCGEMVGWIKMKLGTHVGLGPGHIVLDGDQGPPHPKGQSPQFSAHICCGQMAAWIKMPLAMEVSLGPGDFVFDGDPAPPRKKGTATPTQFLAHVYCGEMAGWIKMPLGTEVKLGAGRCVR